jgi:hypothetical protein
MDDTLATNIRLARQKMADVGLEVVRDPDGLMVGIVEERPFRSFGWRWACAECLAEGGAPSVSVARSLLGSHLPKCEGRPS